MVNLMGSNCRDFRDSPTSSPVSPFSPRSEPTQEVTPLLLLSMFAIAARYTEEIMPKPQDGKMWEAGYDFLEKARVLLGINPASLSIIVLLLMGFFSKIVSYVSSINCPGPPSAWISRVRTRLHGTRVAVHWFVFCINSI